jgi:hypothetical protein
MHVLRRSVELAAHKESYSIELEPKVHPIFVLLEPSYQRLHTNMQPPDSGKGCYCAVAGAAGAAGATGAP